MREQVLVAVAGMTAAVVLRLVAVHLARVDIQAVLALLRKTANKNVFAKTTKPISAMSI